MHQSIGLRHRIAQIAGGLISAAVWLKFNWAVAEILKIGGTGGDLEAMQLVGDSFQALHPNIDVAIMPSLGSSGAIRSVISGTINFAITSHVLVENGAYLDGGN